MFGVEFINSISNFLSFIVIINELSKKGCNRFQLSYKLKGIVSKRSVRLDFTGALNNKRGNDHMTQAKASMAGTVFTVNVAVGEKVIAGQVVVVLESMKMEIPIEVETAGTVTEIKVQVGDFVDENDVLIIVG